MPELAPYGRPAARLWVERGTPGVGDSSIGGPLLWPADEPWPHCTEPEVEDHDPSPAMVPLAQIHAHDVPGPWWPDGMDVLQLLWCPFEHWDAPVNQSDLCPIVELRWRRAAAHAGAAQADPPEPSEFAEEEFLPEPCVFTVEHLVDFPYREELPPELRPALGQLLLATDPEGGDSITRVAGWKLGGWPSWHLNYPRVIGCESCGQPMTLLFTIASDNAPGIQVGRWGELRLFTCPTDHTHPLVADLH